MLTLRLPVAWGCAVIGAAAMVTACSTSPSDSAPADAGGVQPTAPPVVEVESADGDAPAADEAGAEAPADDGAAGGDPAPAPGQVVMSDEPCSSDDDCVKASCCHATACVAMANAPACNDVACTMDCQAGTMDCGGGCSCIEGKCAATLADTPTG